MPSPRLPSQLVSDLVALGVRPGDTLMLHASLRAIGPVEGGPNGVLAALREAVRPAGTLLMILGAELPWVSVNEPPRESPEELAARYAPFDKDTTPSLREVGYLAEAFRQQVGVVVTDHPDGRFAAIGPRAGELFDQTPWDDYYGEGSPLARLCSMGGRVLRLGADLNTVTVLHYAEYLARLPKKRRRTLYFLVRGPAGPEVRAVSSLDNEHGLVDVEGEDYFTTLTRAYLDEGHGRRARVGGAESELLEAAHLVEWGARWMERHLV